MKFFLLDYADGRRSLTPVPEHKARSMVVDGQRIVSMTDEMAKAWEVFVGQDDVWQQLFRQWDNEFYEKKR